MNKASVAALILGVGLAAAPQNSRAALVLYYNFEQYAVGAGTDDAVIDNLVAGQPDGTLQFGTSGGSVAFAFGGLVSGGDLGKSLQLTPAADGNTNLQAPHVDTGITATDLSITPFTLYTAMAWAKFASTTADNMIFGQAQTFTDENVLHHGSRGGRYHSGHWADDIGPDQGMLIDTGNVWHHVAYTNDETGVQTIFVDGVQRATGAAGQSGTMNAALNVLIGTSANAGSFSGQLDEIKIYNEVLTASQIQAASMVPEPASVGMIALGAGALGLLGRRRRA